MKEILYVRIVISYKSLIIKNLYINVQKSIKCTKAEYVSKFTA